MSKIPNLNTVFPEKEQCIPSQCVKKKSPDHRYSTFNKTFDFEGDGQNYKHTRSGSPLIICSS